MDFRIEETVEEKIDGIRMHERTRLGLIEDVL